MPNLRKISKSAPLANRPSLPSRRYNREIGRGDLGECAVTASAIDLTKPGDVALVHRAVTNGWEVPAPIRKAIIEQYPKAIEAAQVRIDSPVPPATQRQLRRRINRMLKLVKLVFAMEANNQMLDWGLAPLGGHSPSSSANAREA